MRQRTLNSINMIDGVLNLMRKNENQWKNEVMITESIDYIEVRRAQVAEELKDVAENQTEGITDEQNLWLSMALDAGYKMGLRISLFARKTNNLVLLKEVNFSRSAIDDGKFSEVIERLRLIAKRAEENKTALKDYKIKAEDITNLKNLIASVENKPAERKSTTAERVQSNAAGPRLISEILTKLKELDDEVEGLIEDEEFVDTYFAVRSTNDRRGGGQSKKKEA